MPSLVSVSGALPEQVQDIAPIVRHINELLQPLTVDGAVINQLHRVVNKFKEDKPITVGAMDRAAARGKLKILKWLQTNQTEGCSPKALENAAANNHLRVASWLLNNYYRKCDVGRAMKAAAANGHVRITALLASKVPVRGRIVDHEATAALEEAARNGHAEVVEMLMDSRRTPAHSAFVAAAASDHVEVLRAISERRNVSLYQDSALEMAARSGCVNSTRFLLTECSNHGVRLALIGAAEFGHKEILRMICSAGRVEALGPALERAAAGKHWDALKFLLEQYHLKCSRVNESSSSEVSGVYCEDHICSAMLSVVRCQRLDMFSYLVKFPCDNVHKIFPVAVASKQVEFVRQLLDICESSLKQSTYAYCAEVGLEEAISTRDVELARLFIGKVNTYYLGTALRKCVGTGSLELVRLAAEYCRSYNLHTAFITAARENQLEIIPVLLEFMDEMVTADCLVDIAKTGRMDLAELLLDKCSPSVVESVFSTAASLGLTALVKLILDKSENFSVDEGIDCAVGGGHTEIVELLLSGSDSSRVKSALLLAASTGQLDVVQLLLSRSARDWIPVAAEIALEKNHDDIVQLLRSKRPRT